MGERKESVSSNQRLLEAATQLFGAVSPPNASRSTRSGRGKIFCSGLRDRNNFSVHTIRNLWIARLALSPLFVVSLSLSLRCLGFFLFSFLFLPFVFVTATLQQKNKQTKRMNRHRHHHQRRQEQEQQQQHNRTVNTSNHTRNLTTNQKKERIVISSAHAITASEATTHHKPRAKKKTTTTQQHATHRPLNFRLEGTSEEAVRDFFCDEILAAFAGGTR
jgi:hypothetical protein